MLVEEINESNRNDHNQIRREMAASEERMKEYISEKLEGLRRDLCQQAKLDAAKAEGLFVERLKQTVRTWFWPLAALAGVLTFLDHYWETFERFFSALNR